MRIKPGWSGAAHVFIFEAAFAHGWMMAFCRFANRFSCWFARTFASPSSTISSFVRICEAVRSTSKAPGRSSGRGNEAMMN